MRTEFSLPQIEERWHNCYLREMDILEYLKTEQVRVEVINFNSTYFLLSRTLNALLKEPNAEPDYLSELNQYATKLPPLGDYSPLKLFKITKK